jgi:thiamine-phosphate pyrophosphorylase
VTPKLHLVAGDEVVASGGFRILAEDLFARCGSSLAIHLRLRCSALDLHEHALGLSHAAGIHGGWCVVNRRVDVALAAGARAVQLGHTAIGVVAAGRVVAAAGRELRLGASVHDVPAAVAAAADGANYLVLGTIFATPSHAGRRGSGPERVASSRQTLDAAGFESVPVIAIGGIDLPRAAEVKAAGAHGVAVQRAVWEAEDPVAASAELCAVLATD